MNVHPYLANRVTILVLSICLGWCHALTSALAQIDFANDVRPLLQRSCYPCHSGTKPESGFRVDLRERAMQPGDHGEKPIIPGDSQRSPLIRFVRGEVAGLQMPPEDSDLQAWTLQEIEIVARWIDEGAIWPEGIDATSNESFTHWSLQPLQAQLPSGLSLESPPSMVIDAMIQQRHHDLGIASTELADRRTLIRRLTFDLIGLPPTPEEIEAFVVDTQPDAWERLVDRLLASPRYGERWGRHWLDVARYTESQGFEYDHLRENAWHYRDYVIQSFNEDKPYDQFMREQIAGDVMQPATREGIIASSFLVCGPWDQAGNGQANATQRAITREEELEDLVAVVCQSFLGLTVNCARCHSHKFDPIPQEEYYRVKSVFEGVVHGERSLLTSDEERQNEAMKARLSQQLQQVQQEISKLESVGWQRVAAVRRSPDTRLDSLPAPTPLLLWNFSEPSSQPEGQLVGGARIAEGALRLDQPGSYFQSPPLQEDIGSKTLEAWVQLSDLDQRGGAAISLETRNGLYFDAIVYGEQQSRMWMAGSEGFARTRSFQGAEESVASVGESSTAGQWVHVAIVYGNDDTITLYRNGEVYGTPYRSSSAMRRFAKQESHVVLGMRHLGGSNPWLVGAIRQAALYNYPLAPDEVSRSFQASGLGITRADILAALSSEESATRTRWLEQHERLRQELDRCEQPVVGYVGKRKQPQPTHVLARGNVKSPLHVVSPGGLSSISGLSHDWNLSSDSDEGERRIRFADWLSNPNNPLPARVFVNRVWHYHFGQGIVPTPNDFGASGEAPSHPELLDYLAIKFRESGWSTKQLHRWIVGSQAYRRGSEKLDASLELDADNRWLWRFTPQRLQAEAVRDAILASSGLLNTKPGGPSFRPFTTSQFNATFYHPADSDHPEWQRRTVYRINVQSGKDPLLDTFDCPDPSVKTPRRGVTTTPLQALELMNSPFVQRASKALANRVMAESDQRVPDAITRAFHLALGRAPSEAELAKSQRLVAEQGIESLCWGLYNLTEFLYVR